MDDIYHKLIFDGKKIAPVYNFTKKDIESTNIVVIKRYFKNIWNDRISNWLGCCKPKACKDHNKYSIVRQPRVILPSVRWQQKRHWQEIRVVLMSWLRQIQKNRDTVIQGLRSIPGVKVEKPEGAFYCFPDFSTLNKDSMAWRNFCWKKHSLLPCLVRSSVWKAICGSAFAGAASEVADGIARIKWALDPNSPREIQIGTRKVVRDWVRKPLPKYLCSLLITLN